ncbi:MAG: cytidine deaminase [Candidatus Merdivicinus sp.]|jgi:cytidine deaminase
MCEYMKSLAEAALRAREYAYCPYSRFAVGAALLAEDGQIFTGCNVENVTQGPGSCAERVALYQAVSAGKRKFRAIAVAGGPAGEMPHEFCTPCGVCRQALAEFCGADFPVLLVTDQNTEVHLLGELLPMAFARLEKGDSDADL